MPDRWALFERRKVITVTRMGWEPLLTRWRLVRTPWFGVFLHHLHRVDPGTALHDHPWNFVSWVVKGWYVEKLPAASRIWRRWSWHRMNATDAHRITLCGPRTWTVVFVGRRRREWGFYAPAGWVAHTDYDRTRAR